MMRLSVVSTGSHGNAYILTGEQNALLLDCGVSFKRVVPMIEKPIIGCLITHEHGDHASGINDVLNHGIDVYASYGTLLMLCKNDALGVKEVKEKKRYEIGEFTVMPFGTEHDANEPFGFLIKDKLTGETMVYATDTYYLRFKFPKLNYWLIECNYVDDLLNEMMVDGDISLDLRNRLKESHMSLNRLKAVVKVNDMAEVRKVVLCHLSDTRSDEKRMVAEVQELFGGDVVAAHNGDVIDMALCPF